MHKTCFLFVLTVLAVAGNCTPCLSQQNEDSILLSHSEKYKVTLNKGLAGLAKPAFGNYTTIDAGRFDSVVTRKKTKDSTAVTAEITSAGIDPDQSAYFTVEKTKFYKLLAVSGTDTTTAVFSIASVSKEKKQTFLGKTLSKEDEGKDEQLSYNSTVEGVIKPGNNIQWQFLVEGFVPAKSKYEAASVSYGFLKNGQDSLYINLGGSFDTDLRLTNSKKQQLASLKFKQKPLYVWLRNDIDKSYQYAIAAFFAVLLAIKDL